MKTAKDFLLAVEIRAFVNAPGVKIPQPYRTWLVELLSQLDAEVLRGERAVQAVIDHYDPLPGTLALAYRVVEAPRQHVFPPACGRCGQRGTDCLCEQPPF
jgi:hypothetical protein